MSDLPQGWEWSTIGDLLAPMSDGRIVHQGWSPKCESFPSSGDDWGVLKTTAIQPGSFQPEHNKQLPKALDPRPGIEVAAGDLLLTCAGPRARCGVACLVTATRPRLMLSGKMYRFRVSDTDVDPRYLHFYLQTARAWLDIDAMKTGGSESGLNLTQARFRELQVPLAPRSEQERIVAAIEEHLSRLDAAVEGVRRVLKRATEFGAVLIETTMTELGEPTTLGSLTIEGGITDGPFGSKLKSSHYTATGPRVVRLENIGFGEFIDEQTHISSSYFEELRRHEVAAGDLLVASLVSDRLRACVAPTHLGLAIVKADCIRVRLSTQVDPRFVNFALRRSQLSDFVAEHASGVGRSRLGLGNVRRIPVPDAPLEVQRAIADTLDDQFAVIRRLEDQSNGVLRRADVFRRSILAAAFAGKLVSQDSADDPASVLLDRIRAERAAAPRAKRGRKASAH